MVIWAGEEKGLSVMAFFFFGGLGEAGDSAVAAGCISSRAESVPVFSPRICFKSFSVEDISFSVGKLDNPVNFI